MEYTELIVAFLCAVAIFTIGYMLGRLGAREAGYGEGYKDGTKYGIDTAMADIHFRKDSDLELELKRIEKENSAPGMVPSELLMAYGVTKARHLPEEVRKQYGIKDDSDATIESLYDGGR